MDEPISWVATAATICGALITASNLGARTTGYGFVIFLVGSLAWLATGLMSDQPALVWANIVLTLLNGFGIWRWLGRQASIEEGGHSALEASKATRGEAMFPASALAASPVVARDGHELGKSVEAMVGCQSGRIHYLVTSDGGVAGIGETLRRVEWSDASFEDDGLVLRLDRTKFCSLPEIDRDDWPGR